jgi:hypothetical protein
MSNQQSNNRSRFSVGFAFDTYKQSFLLRPTLAIPYSFVLCASRGGGFFLFFSANSRNPRLGGNLSRHISRGLGDLSIHQKSPQIKTAATNSNHKKNNPLKQPTANKNYQQKKFLSKTNPKKNRSGGLLAGYQQIKKINPLLLGGRQPRCGGGGG